MDDGDQLFSPVTTFFHRIRTFSNSSASSIKAYKERVSHLRQSITVAIILFCFNILGFLVQIIGVATGFIQIKQPNSSSSCSFNNLNSTQLSEMQRLLQVYQSSVKNESRKLDSLLSAEGRLLSSEREAFRKSLEKLDRDRDCLKNLLKNLNEDAASCGTELVCYFSTFSVVTCSPSAVAGQFFKSKLLQDRRCGSKWYFGHPSWTIVVGRPIA